MNPFPSSPDSQSETWQPLLDGPLAARAEEALDAIAQALPRRLPSAGLAGGEAGLSLFFDYLAQARPGRDWEDRAAVHLDQAVTTLGTEVQGPSLYVGFTGVAWLMDHLQKRSPEPETEDPNEDIDEALEAYLDQGPWMGDYDLIAGLVGMGLYALDRMERPSGRRLLHRVIGHLDATKVELEPGFTWLTSPKLLPAWQRDLSPEGHYNLGLAHGVPAVIALLGQACALGIDTARAGLLLEGAVAWILAQKQPEDSGSCYANTVAVGRENPPVSARIAWCYGDLGLSVAILGAARAAGQSDWEREALHIARVAARRPIAEAGARDAGFCHGAAGNAHLFNRLWQATGEVGFRQAALAWFEETLRLQQPGLGFGGFRSWAPPVDGEEREPWRDEAGLLEGAAGVGLALMGGLYPIPPDWDRMLMTSLSPVHRMVPLGGINVPMSD